MKHNRCGICKQWAPFHHGFCAGSVGTVISEAMMREAGEAGPRHNRLTTWDENGRRETHACNYCGYIKCSCTPKPVVGMDWGRGPDKSVPLHFRREYNGDWEVAPSDDKHAPNVEPPSRPGWVRMVDGACVPKIAHASGAQIWGSAQYTIHNINNRPEGCFDTLEAAFTAAEEAIEESGWVAEGFCKVNEKHWLKDRNRIRIRGVWWDRSAKTWKWFDHEAAEGTGHWTPCGSMVEAFALATT